MINEKVITQNNNKLEHLKMTILSTDAQNAKSDIKIIF